MRITGAVGRKIQKTTKLSVFATFYFSVLVFSFSFFFFIFMTARIMEA